MRRAGNSWEVAKWVLVSKSSAFKELVCARKERFGIGVKRVENQPEKAWTRTVGFKISEGAILSDDKVCMWTWEWVAEGREMKSLE